MTIKTLSAEFSGNTIRIEVGIGGATFSNAIALRDTAPATVASGMRLAAAWIEELKK